MCKGVCKGVLLQAVFKGVSEGVLFEEVFVK